MQRWCDGEPLPPHLAAGGELKYLEVAVETEGRQVTRVLRIVPHRQSVGRERTIDMNTAMARAMERVDLLQRPADRRSEADAIRLLEADANAFWSPTEDQVAMVGSLLFAELSEAELADLRTKLYKPKDSLG